MASAARKNQTKLAWKPATVLSSIHAARLVAVSAEVTDQKLEQAIVPFATEVNNRLLSASIDASSFWSELVCDVVRESDLTAATQNALVASGCSELQLDQAAPGIARQLEECRLALNSQFPRLDEQLQLRSRPLRDRWESVGPGLLRLIMKEIWSDSPPKRWSPTRMDVLLVKPMRGGDGGFDAESRSIWIEAMLTDVSVRVPEVLRLAWLVTQCNIDHHLQEMKEDAIQDEHSDLKPAWSLATVPLVLKCASELDLVAAPDLPISESLELWRFISGDTASEIAVSEIVVDWWKSVEEQPMPLPLKLKELDQALKKSP